MADCIECLAPLADGEWSVHANRGKCMANLQAAARAMSLRIADLEAKLAIHADASRRASVLWCEAHPDAPTYPDGVDLMVWLMAQLADAEAMRRETVALCERVDEARAMFPALPASEDDSRLIDELVSRKTTGLRRTRIGDVAAVLDAIRAVTDGDIALRSPGSSSADGWERAMSSAPGLRELFLAAATAAAEGRR